MSIKQQNIDTKSAHVDGVHIAFEAILLGFARFYPSNTPLADVFIA